MGALAVDPAPLPKQQSGETACGGGAAPPSYGLGGLGDLNNMPALTRLHMDLIARAFACDLTRVITMTIPGPSMPWLRIHEDTHNDIAHLLDVQDEPRRSTIRGKMVLIQRWYAEQLAYLMTQLANIPEGSGTALDNTLIYWGNELGDASGHMNVRVPTVLAGGAGGASAWAASCACAPRAPTRWAAGRAPARG
ncbi:DUF1552 domain-containing protein [Myxococcus sp. MxC21-1]|nr:DUF1552 domain-containing protein [Myxococcus sp. MxC21-1]